MNKTTRATTLKYEPQDLTTWIKSTLQNGASKTMMSDENVSWSGQEIAEKMQKIQSLIEQCTLPGAAVGVLFSNSVAQALTLLAVISSQRVPILINYTDFNESPIQWLERTQNLSMMITMTGFESSFADKIPHILLSATGEIDQFQPKKSIKGWMNDLIHQPHAGTALVIFTSGSTGGPKGVCVPLQGLVETVQHLIPYFKLNDKTVAPILLPICHSMALNTQFLPTFFAGGHCYFTNSRLSMNRIYRTILQQKSTFVSLIGEVLQSCWEERKRKNLPQAVEVQNIQLAGGLISKRHMQMAKDIFPNAIVHKGYGLTEAIRVSMISSENPAFDSSAVGHPLPFVEVEIRNQLGNLTQALEVGEIFVKGPNVSMGFLNSDSRPLPLDEKGFLATGDLGYLDHQQQLCISGRKDGVFKINGYRISGTEIAASALGTSEMIKNAQCLTIEDETRGRTKIVLALEVPQDLQAEFLDQHLVKVQQKMWKEFQKYKSFPKEIFIIGKFPKTSNGKVSLQKIKNLFCEEKKLPISIDDQTYLQFYKLASDSGAKGGHFEKAYQF